jgi:hypothetical protein
VEYLAAIRLAQPCEPPSGIERAIDRITGGYKAGSARAHSLPGCVENAETDRPAVEAGLAFLEVGGDFANGVIAC